MTDARAGAIGDWIVSESPESCKRAQRAIFDFGVKMLVPPMILIVNAGLAAVTKLILDCIRDGVRFDSGFVETLELREYPQFGTPDRVIFGVGDMAIEAARVTDDRTKLTLLPVKGKHDGEAMRAWKIISRQLYNAKVIGSLEHLIRDDDLSAVIEDKFIYPIFAQSPRPELPDEQEFKTARRAELQQQVSGDEIEGVIARAWESEKLRYARLRAQWDEVQRLAALTLEEAIADYLGRTQASAAPSAPSEEAQTWEKIKDHAWDRQALKLWWEGNTCPEIGSQIGVSSDRVRNRLAELRKEYGEEIVPTDEKRKRSGHIRTK